MKEKKNASESKGMEFNGIAITEMAEKAMKNYEQALQTGMKLQKEAAQSWSNLLGQAAAPQEWQKRFTSCDPIAKGMMPAAQKGMEEVLKFMEKNGRTGAELMQKAVEAAQTPVIAESQAKWMEFWTSSLAAAQSNAETLTQISARAMGSWMEFAQSNSEITRIRVPKAV